MRSWAAEADLKRWAAAIAAATLAVTLTLGSVIVLVAATIRISEITNGLVRTLATLVELMTGMLWLLGTVYVTTHLALLIFGKDRSEDAKSEPQGGVPSVE